MGTGKQRKVRIFSPCKALDFDHRMVETLFHFLDHSAPYKILPGELSLAFLDEKAHCQLHADFLNDPSPTDVITFPGDEVDGLAGEICVSIDMARQYALNNGVDFSSELTLYLVHGWLHLAGFDDRNEKDRQSMKKQEQVWMSALETNGRIPLFCYKPHE